MAMSAALEALLDDPMDSDTKALLAITTDTVEDTGSVSFAFMARSRMPSNWRALWGHWGVLVLETKPDTYIDPFRLARREPGAVGDDGTKRWNLNIGNSKGFVLAGGVDQAPNEEGLTDLLKGCPSAILLMEKAVYERFALAAQAAGYEVAEHYYPGSLKTS